MRAPEFLCAINEFLLKYHSLSIYQLRANMKTVFQRIKYCMSLKTDGILANLQAKLSIFFHFDSLKCCGSLPTTWKAWMLLNVPWNDVKCVRNFLKAHNTEAVREIFQLHIELCIVRNSCSSISIRVNKVHSHIIRPVWHGWHSVGRFWRMTL